MDIPLVSVICPTYQRRHLIPLAIKSFLSQDWTHKELVVVDDGPDAVGDLLESVPDAVYVRLAERKRIGVKRNIACENARGEIIVQFDDDDWSAPGRITDQVTRLLESGKSVSGYHSLLFWDAAKKQASRYQGDRDYSCGACLCYRKSFWEKHPFINSSMAEDNEFVFQAKSENQIICEHGGKMIVARIHPNNTSNRTGPLQWPAVPVSEIPQEFFEALG